VAQRKKRRKVVPPEVVISKLKNAVKRLKELTPIDCVYLYGSYAWGRPKPYSDVDVFVVSPAFGRRHCGQDGYVWRHSKTKTLSWNRGLTRVKNTKRPDPGRFCMKKSTFSAPADQ
jgi:hypothetical protein